VPRADYFNEYLACTKDIVALGERKFTQAKRVGKGLLLHNSGLIQLAGRSKLKVARAGGSALPVLKLSNEWLLEGTKSGLAVFKQEPGHHMVFIRSKTPITAKIDE